MKYRKSKLKINHCELKELIGMLKKAKLNCFGEKRKKEKTPTGAEDLKQALFFLHQVIYEMLVCCKKSRTTSIQLQVRFKLDSFDFRRKQQGY